MSGRSMVKLIHADGFFPPGDAEKYKLAVDYLTYQETPYGLEIPNFNMIFPGVDEILSRVVGEKLTLDKENSGVFRKPLNAIIHFEHFSSLNEWCFIVALERTTFNLYHHVKKGGAYGEIDARSALDGWEFNYRNFFEWDVNTNVLLEANQGVFFRPWMFHSLEKGLVQYYRLSGESEEVKTE